MRNIQLHIDDNMFHKMKLDKVKLEKDYKKNLTWEKYIEILFGFNK